MFGLFGSSSEALQMAGADVLAEIVAKRMEPVAKLGLVQQLRVAPVCARWRDALPGALIHIFHMQCWMRCLSLWRCCTVGTGLPTTHVRVARNVFPTQR